MIQVCIFMYSLFLFFHHFIITADHQSISPEQTVLQVEQKIEETDPTVKGAGILPYAYDQKGNVYFLLGRESDEGTWCDFGGRRDKSDKNAQEIAMREFAEETRYVFGKYNKDKTLSNVKEKNQSYAPASNAYIKNKIKDYIDHPKKTYRIYFAQVDYIPVHLFLKAPYDNNSEKNEYAWVEIQDFMNVIEKSKNRNKTWYNNKKIRPALIDILQLDQAKKIIYTIVQVQENQK